MLTTGAYAQDSLNCKLVAKTTNNVSAYSLQVKDNYAFIGQEELSILDVTDIYNPTVIFSDSLAWIINSIFIDNNLAYLGVNDGLIILDITSYPSPVILSYFKTSAYIEEVFVENDVAYLGTLEQSFLIFDVSDPANPFEINRVALSNGSNIDDIWGIEKVDSTLFVASEDTGLKIFDVGNPLNIIEHSTTIIPINASAVDVKVKDSIAYVTHPQNLFAFNIKNKATPILIDSILGGGGYSIYIEDDFLYCLSMHQLRVVNISNPSALKLVGFYPLPGGIGSDLYAKNGLVYVPMQNGGIYFIQFDKTTSIKGVDNIINEYVLSQNYPNPFNPGTIISYSIPKQSSVLLRIFDALGKEVKVLVNEIKASGSYKERFDASNLSSGIYFYRLAIGDFVETKKLVLLR